MAAAGMLATIVASCYVAVEVIFYLIFHYVFIPRANKLEPPPPFRDYGKERAKLMARILKRIEATCALHHRDVASTIRAYLTEWFHVEKNLDHEPPRSADGATAAETTNNFSDVAYSPPTLVLSPESSDDDADSLSSRQSSTLVSSPEANTSGGSAGGPASEPCVCLYREDIDDFFAWAFFGKHYSTLLPWEILELSKCFELLEQEHNIRFPQLPAGPDERRTQAYHNTHLQCMTLEPVNAIHRPLLVYLIVAVLKIGTGILLRILGYRRVVATTGLVGWYKPGKKAGTEHLGPSFMPLLFFHGLAPCSLTFYLPMILFGIATEPDRPMLLFENRSISCSIDFAPLTEDQTVQGIQEIVDRCLGSDQIFSAMGHSFGSCTIAWLLKSDGLSRRMQQIVLLDAAAILLSEPDVMLNFAYAREMTVIRMAVSSELFTQFYLRRHFAWYNSELWLDDLQEHHRTLVCLSQGDEIVNAKKVQEELERYSVQSTRTHQLRTIYWKNASHAACMASPTKWKEIKGVMLEQELEIVQGQRVN
jgi:pimeloyl-ACP methyl ester carboxylesterase